MVRSESTAGVTGTLRIDAIHHSLWCYEEFSIDATNFLRIGNPDAAVKTWTLFCEALIARN